MTTNMDLATLTPGQRVYVHYQYPVDSRGMVEWGSAELEYQRHASDGRYEFMLVDKSLPIRLLAGDVVYMEAISQ